MDIQDNEILTKLLVEFWNQTTVTFQFPDLEITPTLEDVRSLTDLSLEGRILLAPSAMSKNGFLHGLGLSVVHAPRNIEGDWVNSSYLFHRFGCQRSYDNHRYDFACNRTK